MLQNIYNEQLGRKEANMNMVKKQTKFRNTISPKKLKLGTDMHRCRISSRKKYIFRSMDVYQKHEIK